MAEGRRGKKSSAKKSSAKKGGRSKQGRAAKSSSARQARDRRESGEPGGGQGRRDDIGGVSRVYPLGAENIPPDAEIRWSGQWGGGDYNESGGSELVYRDGIVLGGLTAGPDGEPTIDIHSGRPPAERRPEPEEETKDPDSETLFMRGLPPPRDDEREDDRSRS